jgi:hypothetical protein
MKEKTSTNNFTERGSESRHILDMYYSVQFSLNSTDPVYIFKLRDISYNEPCILVKEDSVVLKSLKVNDILNMEYNPPESSGSSKLLSTRIRDITKSHYGCFTGHSLVGLSIIDEHDMHA